MADPAFYEYRAPKFVKFEPAIHGDISAYLDLFENDGEMDIDMSLPLPSEPDIRWSSTPNKKDSCTQTQSERTEQEENILSNALNSILHLETEYSNNRRSVRFNDAVDVFPKSPNSSIFEKKDPTGGDPNPNKRQTTPIIGNAWHQALKYRSVELRVATPKPDNKSKRSSLVADPTLKIGTTTQTPSSIPRLVRAKVRVDPKPVVEVKPYKLITYKPRQTPLEDPVKFFQRNKDTPARQTQTKPAVRRLSIADKVESPKTPTFRARPPLSLYQKPFVPKPAERPPTKIQPFRLHTEERAKKREEYEHKIQHHLLELEAERQRRAAERERQESLELKELRRVKIHARPVPSYVYSPHATGVENYPKTPSVVQRPKTSTRTV